MSRLPAVTERSARFIVAVLVCVKLVLLVWNASVYDGVTYQPERHAERALSGGSEIGTLSYDPPLYYLPARLLQRRADAAAGPRSADEPPTRRARKQQAAKAENERGQLLDALRYSNVLWVGFFYVAWIYYAFARLLRDRRAWFLASLALLAIPGYQKLAAMSHPDNLLAAASALAVCAWLWLRERWQAGYAATPVSPDAKAPKAKAHVLRDLALFSFAVGLVGLTRPLALAFVAPLTLVALAYAARFGATRWQQMVGRAALVITLVGVLSGSWYVARWHKSGAVLASVPAEVAADYEPLRRGFSYAHYFLSFYPGELWSSPNVSFGAAEDGAEARSARANSFFTLLHSEVWGDHWLGFSGAKQKDTKVWAKRVSIGTAVLVPFISLGLLLAWLGSFAKRSASLWQAGGANVGDRLRRLGANLETELVLGAISLLGAALFVWWQAGPALMPGDQSSLKFIHVAAFFPPAIALLLSRSVSKLPALLLAGYALVLFMAAFPVAMYYPR